MKLRGEVGTPAGSGFLGLDALEPLDVLAASRADALADTGAVVGAEGATGHSVRHIDLRALVALVGDVGACTFSVGHPAVAVPVVVEAVRPRLAGLTDLGVAHVARDVDGIEGHEGRISG